MATGSTGSSSNLVSFDQTKIDGNHTGATRNGQTVDQLQSNSIVARLLRHTALRAGLHQFHSQLGPPIASTCQDLPDLVARVLHLFGVVGRPWIDQGGGAL